MNEASAAADSPEQRSDQVARLPFVLSPDCIDSRYDQEQVRVGLGLAQRYVPMVVAGRYHLLERVARGSMGSVYRARDDRLGRQLAIKVVSSRSVTIEGRQERLIDEAKALARVRHENVLVVYDVGETDAREAYIAMDYVAGSTLRRWQQGRPLAALLEVYVEAGRGLAAAHRGGVVHRDFKPDNVLVSEADGVRRVVVGDFGLASASTSTPGEGAELGRLGGPGAGTPSYMPPEQREGESDARCDQYAFCVSLWEAIMGRRPFAAARVRGSELRCPPQMPRWLYRCLSRGLAWSPKRRYADMGTLLLALERGPSRMPALMSTTLVAVAVAVVAGVLLRGPNPTPSSAPESVDLRPFEPRFGPLIPMRGASETKPTQRSPAVTETSAPAGGDPPGARSAPTRDCGRDTLHSLLSELGYRCEGAIELELDDRGLVHAPERPRVHELRAPGSYRSCMMKVKCPDDEY